MSRFLLSLLVILLVIFQYRLWWGENGLLEYWHIQQQVSELESSNQELQQRNRLLNAQVEDLKTGLAAVEERARFDLGMLGAQETFFWLLDTPPSKFTQAGWDAYPLANPESSAVVKGSND